jgi:hypothetical protein
VVKTPRLVPGGYGWSPTHSNASAFSAAAALHAPFLTLAIASRDHVHGIEAVVQLPPKLPFAAEFWLCDGV